MFQREPRPRLSAVKTLIAVNLVIFVIMSFLTPFGLAWVETTFGLSGRGMSRGMVWQLLTHQFLHANFLHVAMNMLGLWFAGRIMENLLGARAFVLLYLTCGVAGGLCQLVFVPGAILIGASGAVCGLITAFSALYPEMQITALLFFVIPVRLRAKWLGYGLVIVSVLFTLTGLGGNVGHAAHLGGALAGYVSVWISRRRFRVVR